MNDLISRQETIKAFRAWWDDPEDARSIKRVIESLPSIDPVKHGEWITISQKIEITSWDKKCSECGAKAQLEHNYCPNCGAQMKKIWEVNGMNSTAIVITTIICLTLIIITYIGRK